MRLKHALFVPLLILALLFSSCGGQLPDGDGESITFTDALGREVEVKKSPKRVAALLGSLADIWTLAGGELVAAAEDAWSDFGLSLNGEVVNLGGAHSPSLERLLSADPDFVIASASTAKNLEFREVLERAGITVAYFDIDSFNDYLLMLDLCTRITDRRDLYEKNGIAIAARIAAIKAEVGERMPSVLLLRASSGGIKAKGSSGTVLGEMLYDLGCVNIADNDENLLENLSIESIIEKNPEHIFIVSMGSDVEATRKNIETIMNENPAWKTLSAVKAGRVHYVERGLFHLKPNARWADAYEIIKDILQGEN